MFLTKRQDTWYIFYTNAKGKRTCISTHSKFKAEAMKFLTRFRDELKKRELIEVIPIQLQDFINKFLYYSSSIHTYKTSKDYKSELNILMKFAGNIQVNDFNYKKVSEYVRERGRKSIYASSKSLRYLKSIFNWAVSEQYLTENPCKTIKPIKVPEKQPLFLTESDFQPLIDKIQSKDLKDIVIFAVNTGLRKMEILTLHWNQINFKDRYVILDNANHTTKSKKVRTIPLNLKALQVLTERQLLNQNLVFTLNDEAVNPDFVCKEFKKCVIDAKLNSKLKFHSTRHTFASWLVQKGISLYQVSKLLGHSDLKTTEIYSHLSPENFRNAVDSLI